MNIRKAGLSVLAMGILAALAGCGSSTDNASLAPFFAPFATPAPLARTLVAANASANTVTSYDANGSGNQTPLSSIGLTQLSGPNSMAVDTVHNEIFVSNLGKTVTVYSRTANGSVAPSRVLYLPAGQHNGFESVAVDPVNNELIVANEESNSGPPAILVYSRTATGDATPLRTIAGSATLLNSLDDLSVAVDTVNNELVVDNGPQLLVFSHTANGNVPPLRSLSGNNTGLAGNIGNGAPAIDTINNEILVPVPGSGTSSAILAFSRTASGNVAPLRSISGSNTGLTDGLWGLAVDPVNNELAVTDQSGPIEVFSRTASGNVDPLRTVSGTLPSPTGLFIDTANNELDVTDSTLNSVDVFSRTATGNAAPLRSIADPHTGLSLPLSVALDSADALIAVANLGVDIGGPGTVNVYKSTANGDVAPVNSVVINGLGANTGLSDGFSESVAIDPVNKELVVANYAGTANDAIVVFSLSANGTPTPLREINGSSTGLFAPEGVYVDPVNNEIGVFNDSVGTATITVYSRTANGNAPPLRTISVPANSLGGTAGQPNESSRSLAIDPVNNEIWLSGGSDNNIQVFSRTATGAATPLRTISGSGTGLDIDSGIAVDPIGNEIFVSNVDLADPTNSIEVFSRTANGNVAPLRTISGSGTNLTNPASIAVSP
ncbi:MAG TPA: hypothetical protein VGO93_05350 [Candidatus Xenobia bacterium]|jgi:6-phosphogluconolactonase (cycloisomerase 2 family)